MEIKILILAANPWETRRLDLNEEQQRIQNLWDSFDYSHQRFDIRFHPALQGKDLQETVLRFKPHLLHFSGHGESDGLVFTDLNGDNAYEVSKQALAQLFKSCPDLKAVFLNACYSANQANEIVEQVDYLIGMNAAIDDLAAISFSQGFYTAIFTQQKLDIEQAFHAGLTKMEIDHISESERNKPLLRKRPQSYVPTYKHDVFISFADDDSQWANGLTDYLRKQLQSKLATFDGFQLYTNNDFEQLAQSATLLIITSPAYCQQYQAQFERLKTQTKQQSVFLVEQDVCKSRPEFLKGFTPYKFWLYDDSEGMMQVTGDSYFAKADELAAAIAKRLIELKDQQQHQQRIEQQRQQQQQTRLPNAHTIDAFVFLHSAPEDLNLTADIVPLLEENGIDYVLPLQRSVEVSAGDIRQDIENNILNCDAVLILYEQTTPVWIREQLGMCRRLRKHDNPLKIIAVYKSKEKPEVNFQLDNLHIYICSPEEISTYLPDFIEELAE